MNYDHSGALNGRANEGKPWRLEDDEFICEYHLVGLDLIGPHDLGRSPESTKARWDFLKATGANKAIRAMRKASNSSWHAPGKTLDYRRAWKERRAKALAKYYDCIRAGA